MKLFDVLVLHADRYPRMMPQDAVKLVYQHTFGGGHLIADASRARARLNDELAALYADGTQPLTEPIGNGLVRVSLAAWKAQGRPKDALFDAFLASSECVAGTRDQLLERIGTLRAATADGLLPFSPRALEDYLAPYLASGCPMVSHSEAYRAAYRPAYRVVAERFV